MTFKRLFALVFPLVLATAFAARGGTLLGVQFDSSTRETLPSSLRLNAGTNLPSTALGVRPLSTNEFLLQMFSRAGAQVASVSTNGTAVFSSARLTGLELTALGHVITDDEVTALDGITGNVEVRLSAVETGIVASASATSNYFVSALNDARYMLSFPTGLVLFAHPRSGFYQDSGVTPATNQGLIAQWSDASGRSNHLTSTNLLARPRMVYEDGLPAAFFANGESQQLSNVLEFPPALRIDSRAFSAFFVLRPMATLTNMGVMQASNNNPGIIIESAGTERGVISLYGSSLVQTHIPMRASRSVLGVVGDTSMARVYHHGESTNMAPYAAAVARGGILGRWVNQRPYYGKVESVVLFDRALTPIEAESVVQKLNNAFDLATPNRNRLLVLGDSIARGDTGSNGVSYPWQVAKRLGAEWEVLNYGLGGQYLSDIRTYATNSYWPLVVSGRRNVVLIHAGSNDGFLAGNSGETIFTNLMLLASGLRSIGAQVVVTDILPRQNNATFEGRRTTFNALVAANWTTFADGYVPFASDSNIGDSGDESSTVYYSDTIHPTETGASIMANWTVPVLLKAAIQSSSVVGNLTVTNQLLATNVILHAAQIFGGLEVTALGNTISEAEFATLDGLTGNVESRLDALEVGGGAGSSNYQTLNAGQLLATNRVWIGSNSFPATALGIRPLSTNEFSIQAVDKGGTAVSFSVSTNGDVSARSFSATASDVAGYVQLAATNSSGAVVLTIDKDYLASNRVTLAFSNPVLGQVIGVSAVSGNNVTVAYVPPGLATDSGSATNVSLLNPSLHGNVSAYALRADSAYVTNALSLSDYASVYYDTSLDELVLTNLFHNRAYHFGASFRIPTIAGSGNHLHVAADGSFSRTNITSAGGGGGTFTNFQWTVELDGFGGPIATGFVRHARIPSDCTIKGWDIISDDWISGSLVLDVWKTNWAGLPATSATSIAGSEKPTLSSAVKNQDTNLTTWDASCAKGDYLGFHVDSSSVLTRATIYIYYTVP